MPTDSSYNEKEILQDLSSGKESAFAAIYEKYSSSLINFAAARLSSLEEAKDIIHDLFVYIWEERANIRITYSLQAFLFTAVRYRIIDHIRRNMTRGQYAVRLQSLTQNDNEAIENTLAAKELNLAIEKAVNELPARVKEIYRLSRNEHLTINEIAGKLNLSPQTVKNQLTTALSLLRSVIKAGFIIFFILFCN